MMRAKVRRGGWSRLYAWMWGALSALPGCHDGGHPPIEAMSGGGSGGGSSGGGGEGATTTDAAPEAGETGEAGPGPAITWHQHIAPIVGQKCGGCHVAGGIAPFSLTTYAEALPFAGLLLDAVEQGSMPPFLAETTEECAPRFGFVDDPRLTDRELALLRGWALQGAQEGDPTTAAPLPPPPELELADADIHLEIPGEVTVDGDKDQYVCFSIDPKLSDITWIDGLQVSPGNRKVVHHVLVYLDPDRASEQLVGPDGSYPCFGGPGLANTALIAAWAPGTLPIVPPEQVAMYIQAGSRIVLNVHYHPTGAPEHDDSTTLHLRRRAGPPEYVGLLALIGNRSTASAGLLPGPNDPDAIPTFLIPAGAVGHTESMRIEVTPELPELRLFGVGVHMHHVGTDMRISIERPQPAPGEPGEECLLQTPRWDFQWQRGYHYDAPLDDLPRARPGDTVALRCTYDNSLANPAVVRALAEQGLDAPTDVHLGESTLDEMCLGVFGVAVALKDAF